MMRQLFKKSFGDFQRSYAQFISFELVYSLLASILFAPFLTYIFNRLLIMFRSNPTLINNEVFSFGMSFDGMLALFLISFLSVAVLFIEFGVLVIISYKSYFKRPIYVSTAIKTVLMKLPKLLGLGVFPIIFLLLLIIPWVNVATLPVFVDINHTITFMEIFNDSWLVQTGYVIGFILLIYLFLRWIFALHFIFLQDTSVWAALKNSWRITKHRQARLITYLLILNIGIFLVGFLMMFFVGQFVGMVDSKAIGHMIGNYLLTIASYVTLLMSLFLIPMNIIILTRLYYKFSVQLSSQKTVPAIYESRFLLNVEKSLANFLKNRKSAVRVTVAMVLALMLFINYTTSDAVVYLPWDVQVAAHRGDGFHSPENSMSGIKAAIEKGIDAVEIDVAMTKDRVLVLSHDGDLTRMADRPERIQDLTFDELQEIDIGKKFDEAFTGEKIPALAEALDYIAETETKVIIDVKVFGDEAVEYAQKIVELINVYGLDELSYVQSFNNNFLQIVRKLNPEIEIGQIIYLSAGDLSKLDVDFYTIRQTMLTDHFIKKARKQNRDVWVWTVNNPRNIKEVLKYDIDGVITDYPERVYQFIEQK